MRWAALALLAGLVVFEVASALHVTGPDLNDNAAIFRTYAASDGWVAVHLVRLAGGLLILGGLGRAAPRLGRQARHRGRRGDGRLGLTVLAV